MTIKYKPMGAYQTNCYVADINGKQLIIDPGMNALPWIKKNCPNPIAILNTHGHFDHVWSNQAVKDEFNIPIYCPKNDTFMLENDPFDHGTPPSCADYFVDPDEEIELLGKKIKFHFFPGHTPGCSAITIDNHMFSGDFIFQGSIGRVDFPFSKPSDMKKSINKVLNYKKDYIIYPGHGDKTSLQREKTSLKAWLNYI
jgi:glyoxylase-like metal-dependent hydrolase (beta-lactamase superfamily II)